MKTEINIPFILDVLKTIGNDFLKDFKKEAVPQDEAGFYELFLANEEKCLSFIKERLLSLYPGIPFADGEFDFNEQSQPLPLPEYWVCDAMDGAIQYIQHIPGWTINLVLVRDGRPYFSAIYDPLMGELFWAKKNKGAYLNDQRIEVSKKQNTRLMLAAFDHPSAPEKINGLNQRIGSSVKNLLEQFAVVRNFGPHGLQLAYVAAGRIDIFCQEGLDTYNWLPGLLLAKEAGAKLSTTNGTNWQWGNESLFVAAPGIINTFVKLKQE